MTIDPAERDAFAARTKKIRDFFKKSRERRQSRPKMHPKDAAILARLDALIEKRPNRLSIRLLYARFFESLTKCDEAVPHWEFILEHAPDTPKWFQTKNTAREQLFHRYSSREHDQAWEEGRDHKYSARVLALLHDAIKQDPSVGERLVGSLAKELADQGKYDEAIAKLLEATSSGNCPKGRWDWYIGVYLTRAGRFSEALPYLRKEEAEFWILEPKSSDGPPPQLLECLALALEGMGNSEEAEKYRLRAENHPLLDEFKQQKRKWVRNQEGNWEFRRLIELRELGYQINDDTELLCGGDE